MTNSNSGIFMSNDTSKKKFKMNGFKFFQYALNQLRDQVYEYSSLGYEKGLDASAAALYVGLFSQCNSAGVLDADFHVSTISKLLNIPRATGSNGMNQLLDRGLVKEIQSENKTQYEVVGYAENNLAREEYLSTKKLNYFTVPFELLHTTVLANLVTKKSAKGIIVMLEIFNAFRHKLIKEKVSALEFTYELTTKTLKEKLRKSSSKRVREILDVLSPIFTFKPVNVEERKPRENVISRLRKAVTQLHIKKYEIHIAPGCIIEKEAIDVEATKALKDADYRIKLLELQMFQKDRIGIRSAYKGAVKEIAHFVKDKKQKTILLRDSMQYALESLESFLRSGNKLKNLGGFLNAKLQEYVFKFLDQNKLFIDIESFYKMTDSPVPTIWIKYREHKKELLA